MSRISPQVWAVTAVVWEGVGQGRARLGLRDLAPRGRVACRAIQPINGCRQPRWHSNPKGELFSVTVPGPGQFISLCI